MSRKLITDMFRPFNDHQVFLLQTMIAELQMYGIDSLEEVVAVAKEYTDDLARSLGNQSKPLPPRLQELICPDCGAPVLVSPVNVSRCTNVGGPWKSSLECSNKLCRFSELSEKTPKEINKL